MNLKYSAAKSLPLIPPSGTEDADKTALWSAAVLACDIFNLSPSTPDSEVAVAALLSTQSIQSTLSINPIARNFTRSPESCQRLQRWAAAKNPKAKGAPWGAP